MNTTPVSHRMNMNSWSIVRPCTEMSCGNQMPRIGATINVATPRIGTSKNTTAQKRFTVGPLTLHAKTGVERSIHARIDVDGARHRRAARRFERNRADVVHDVPHLFFGERALRSR